MQQWHISCDGKQKFNILGIMLIYFPVDEKTEW